MKILFSTAVIAALVATAAPVEAQCINTCTTTFGGQQAYTTCCWNQELTVDEACARVGDPDLSDLYTSEDQAYCKALHDEKVSRARAADRAATRPKVRADHEILADARNGKKDKDGPK